MIDERDWVVVAPWWKWSDPKDSAKGRATAPVFQKYDTPSLVNEFLKDPQRSLTFTPVDQIGKRTSLKELKVGGKNARLSDWSFDPDGDRTRKIFLPTHRRFYLVVCQIHCDAPGFPRAAPGDICEVGFTLRRRSPRPAAGATPIVRQIEVYAAKAQAHAAHIEAALEDLPAPGAKGVRAAVQRTAHAAALEARPAARARLALARQMLDAIRGDAGLDLQREGWFPARGPRDKVGAWKVVEEAPGDLAGESTFPMYPLFADPTIPDHPAKHGTIYFGVLPAGSDETDDGGRPRFDDDDLYEAYCYVKRHHRPHAKDQPCPCPHGTFWSAPGEAFRLAPHFDLDGTSNRPVIVQLPDLDDLAARARPSFGVGLKKPKGSLSVTGSSSGAITGHGRTKVPEICFFAIPLFTLVATFLFSLFLPVVVLLFGLFFLLRLKFCIAIPPVIDVSVQAHLDLQAKIKADLQVGATVSIDAATPNNVAATATAELGKLFPSLPLVGAPDDPSAPPPAWKSAAQSALELTYTTGALAQMDVEVADASAKVAGQSGTGGPSLTGDLAWEATVKWA
jgi:hypothetical protein